MIKNKKIIVPIYYIYDENGNIKIDVESMQEEFNNLLNEVVLNPQNYIK